jgi:hypothetical protein
MAKKRKKDKKKRKKLYRGIVVKTKRVASHTIHACQMLDRWIKDGIA